MGYTLESPYTTTRKYNIKRQHPLILEYILTQNNHPVPIKSFWNNTMLYTPQIIS